ncbi:hypothetical protein [Acuticoccus sp.]|uniref:hypothetical protein n=1 Tax=Acuticoccus sp. TaxID=1904378 RepID=UPI003B5238CD
MLDGGNGDDTMRGGAGQDVFILGRGGHDVVVDFEAGVDVLRLKGDPTLSVEAVDDSVTVRWNHGSATFLGLTVDEFEAGLG